MYKMDSYFFDIFWLIILHWLDRATEKVCEIKQKNDCPFCVLWEKIG